VLSILGRAPGAKARVAVLPGVEIQYFA